jgi:hypothetical protein
VPVDHRSVTVRRDSLRTEALQSCITEVTHMIPMHRAARPKAATWASSLRPKPMLAPLLDAPPLQAVTSRSVSPVCVRDRIQMRATM